MSDEEVVPHAFWQRFIAESKSRAKAYLATAPRCDKCGLHVATPGRFRHYLCEPDTIVGHACTCRTGCSAARWGDGPIDCDALCRPCKLNRGQILPSRKAKG
jgi:hypothetical protein